ncbi:MAG: hypothetical protein J0H49_10520 [Acidobacteria bacterium]|nr:hypothetical protein [Acidobacteriota bacterium]
MPMSQISERRLAANRANARKSTGPRTAQGKAKVSENARRTGIYSEDHRMPPRIEAHFQALAEARTQPIADPALRALSFDWHMLQGHLDLHDSRERALFNAGLEYGRGNEDAAREWVLRQHGYIQALNRYAGWIQMRLRKIEAAILANPAGMDHLTQFFHPEPEQPQSQPHGKQHSCSAELPLCPVETPKTAASSLPKPGPVCPQLGPAEPATVEPTQNFEGTNPPSSTQPGLIPIAEFEGTNPFIPATNQLRQLHQPEPHLEQLLPVVHRPVPITTTPEPTPSQPQSHPPTREGNPVQGEPQTSGSSSDQDPTRIMTTQGKLCLLDHPGKHQPGTHQQIESAGLSPPPRNISHRTAVDEASAQPIEPI